MSKVKQTFGRTQEVRPKKAVILETRPQIIKGFGQLPATSIVFIESDEEQAITEFLEIMGVPNSLKEQVLSALWIQVFTFENYFYLESATAIEHPDSENEIYMRVSEYLGREKGGQHE